MNFEKDKTFPKPLPDDYGKRNCTYGLEPASKRLHDLGCRLSGILSLNPILGGSAGFMKALNDVVAERDAAVKVAKAIGFRHRMTKPRKKLRTAPKFPRKDQRQSDVKFLDLIARMNSR